MEIQGILIVYLLFILLPVIAAIIIIVVVGYKKYKVEKAANPEAFKRNKKPSFIRALFSYMLKKRK